MDDDGRRFRAWVSSFITPTPSANMPTTGTREFGRLDKALDAAAVNQWTVVDMKTDWKVIFPFELK